MQKHCGRCHIEFNCRAEEIALCDCAKVELSENTRQFLAKTKYDCLCNTCLIQLNQIIEENRIASSKCSDDLKEGVHYYMDGHLLIMNELFHIQRGFCCENDCKHCAYGYRK